MVRRTIVTKPSVQFVAQSIAQFLDDARLADTRLAGEQHHLAIAFLCSLPSLKQESDLGIATNKRGEVSAVQCLEAVINDARANHLPNQHRIAEADGHLLENLIFEELAEKATGRVGYDHSVWHRAR